MARHWKEEPCRTCGAKVGESCGRIPLGLPWGWERTAPHAARKKAASLPTIKEMSGLIKNFTGDMTMKEYMEMLSDEFE